MNISHILAIDQGTSGSKAILFDTTGKLIHKSTTALRSYYPQPGFVEQHPEEIYQTVISSIRNCLHQAEREHGISSNSIQAVGISNQRETFVIWDEGGIPIHHAVVWQCKRSVKICEELISRNLNSLIHKKTGLTIDPYFSATKLMWLYQNNEKVREAIDAGKAYFGTVDTWLLYKLTKGQTYLTDHTNASRTLFYNINDLHWDEELLKLFGLENLNLPSLNHSNAHFGETDFERVINEAIPITGVIGDSHAAFFGEGCFETGSAKATLGTGSSILWNAGDAKNKGGEAALTTVGWSTNEQFSYAFEGIIVSCGATLEWLKNKMNIFEDYDEIEPMAQSLPTNEGVYIIPAFSGLGAPHWQTDRKASFHGVTFGTTKAHFVRAALESIAFQIKDVIVAIEKETNQELNELKLDGGMTANQFLIQLIADVLEKPVTTINISDASGYGAALMAGLGSGIWENFENLPSISNQETKAYQPDPQNKSILDSYSKWQEIILKS